MINYDDIIATVQKKNKDESDKEYESQPIILLKAALESVDNLMPSGFDRKALSVLRHWNQKFRAINEWIKSITNW